MNLDKWISLWEVELKMVEKARKDSYIYGSQGWTESRFRFWVRGRNLISVFVFGHSKFHFHPTLTGMREGTAYWSRHPVWGILVGSSKTSMIKRGYLKQGCSGYCFWIFQFSNLESQRIEEQSRKCDPTKTYSIPIKSNEFQTISIQFNCTDQMKTLFKKSAKKKRKEEEVQNSKFILTVCRPSYCEFGYEGSAWDVLKFLEHENNRKMKFTQKK